MIFVKTAYFYVINGNPHTKVNSAEIDILFSHLFENQSFKGLSFQT